MPDITDTLHARRGASAPFYTLEIRTAFNDVAGEWIKLRLSEEDYKIDEDDATFASEADLTVQYRGNNLDEYSAAKLIRMYAEVRFSVTVSAFGIGRATRQLFTGYISEIDINPSSVRIHCFDIFGFLERTYFNFGTMEAKNLKLVSVSDDPGYTPPDPDIQVEHLVSLVEVTENSESRWVIPNEIDTLDLYQTGYIGGASNEVYTGTQSWTDTYGGGSFAYKAGNNRRTWKIIGRVYDTAMDLTSFGIDLKYPEPIPAEYYQIGTDTGDYLEFKGYPGGQPSGHVIVEWIICYQEGTNDIEHVLQKLLSPTIKGKATGATSATVLVASGSRFIRDGILAGATIRNITTGNTATIVSVDSQTQLTTTSITGSWTAEDTFEIVDGCELLPRLRDGLHYFTSGVDQTIFPSLITVNQFQWNASDGSVMQGIEHLFGDFAPPNYKTWINHETGLLHAQYVEITPHSNTTPYYNEAYPLDDDYHEVTVVQSTVAPKNEDGFFTCIIVEGVNEHPDNLARSDNVYTIPPGTGVSGWLNNSGIFPGAWQLIGEMGEHGVTYSYATAPWSRLLDRNGDSCIAWESKTGIGEGSKFAPFCVVDLDEAMEIGRILAVGLRSGRDFTWGLRFEICEKDGIITSSGEKIPNKDAEWQLMHPDYYNFRLHSYEQVDINDGFIASYGRYILISMSWAKTQDVGWTSIGLSDLGIYRRDIVTGQARLTDRGRVAYTVCTNVSPHPTNVKSAGGFAGVTAGDEIINLTQGYRTTVFSVTDASNIVANVVVGKSWKAGDWIDIRAAANKTGKWYKYDGDTLDDAVSLLNMPMQYAQTAGGKPTEWGASADQLFVGHRTAYHQDHSLSDTNVCRDRAEEMLIETIRNFRLVGCVAKIHLGIRKYKTVLVRDPRTGLNVKVLVTHVTHQKGQTSFDGEYFGVGAPTGEIPEALT